MGCVATTEPPVPVRDAVRIGEESALLRDVELRIDVELEGVRFDQAAVQALVRSDAELDSIVRGEPSRLVDIDLQRSFRLPSGISVGLRPGSRSPYRLEIDGSVTVLHGPDGEIGQVALRRRHDVLSRTLSTGERFEQIGSVNPEGGLRVPFSNECSLKDTNEDCKFCDFNHRARLSNGESVFLKSPRQVAEAYALARAAGTANHFNLTGGFIPERRELEYYLDVAEEVRERTGLERFHGTAVIGAPADLRVIEKYRDSGFDSVAINLEIWDKDIFRAICPGKERRNGGWSHWVAALEHAVSVFGRGNVKSNIVAGLEPKESILEGVEYLASKGVVCLTSAFLPRPGTALEGHRSPEASWHFDLQSRMAALFRRHGYTIDQLQNTPAPGRSIHDLFRIQEGDFHEGLLEPWTFPVQR